MECEDCIYGLSIRNITELLSDLLDIFTVIEILCLFHFDESC